MLPQCNHHAGLGQHNQCHRDTTSIRVGCCYSHAHHQHPGRLLLQPCPPPASGWAAATAMPATTSRAHGLCACRYSHLPAGTEAATATDLAGCGCCYYSYSHYSCRDYYYSHYSFHDYYYSRYSCHDYCYSHYSCTVVVTTATATTADGATATTATARGLLLP